LCCVTRTPAEELELDHWVSAQLVPSAGGQEALSKARWRPAAHAHAVLCAGAAPLDLSTPAYSCHPMPPAQTCSTHSTHAHLHAAPLRRQPSHSRCFRIMFTLPGWLLRAGSCFVYRRASGAAGAPVPVGCACCCCAMLTACMGPKRTRAPACAKLQKVRCPPAALAVAKLQRPLLAVYAEQPQMADDRCPACVTYAY